MEMKVKIQSCVISVDYPYVFLSGESRNIQKDVNKILPDTKKGLNPQKCMLFFDADKNIVLQIRAEELKFGINYENEIEDNIEQSLKNFSATFLSLFGLVASRLDLNEVIEKIAIKISYKCHFTDKNDLDKLINDCFMNNEFSELINKKTIDDFRYVMISGSETYSFDRDDEDVLLVDKTNDYNLKDYKNSVLLDEVKKINDEVLTIIDRIDTIRSEN